MTEELKVHGDIHDLTYEELLADFSLRDQRKYRDYINNNFEELMASDEKYQEFIDEFFPEYDYAKVNRLLVIRSQIFTALAKQTIDSDIDASLKKGLENMFTGTHEENVKVMEMLTGHSASYQVDPKQLDHIINYPWSGKSFSQKLWGNVSNLEKILSDELLKGFARGDGVKEILDAMMQRFQGASKKNMERLVRTEYTHFAEDAIHRGYKETGIEEYENLSAEDERVCSICGAEHGKRHYVDDAVPGVNRSPYHPGCRCTDIPVVPDIGEEIDAIYEEMFGDLLDDFAESTFGIPRENLHPKTDEKSGKSGYNDGSKNNPKKLTDSIIRGAPMDIDQADGQNANPYYLGRNAKEKAELERLTSNISDLRSQHEKAKEAWKSLPSGSDERKKALDYSNSFVGKINSAILQRERYISKTMKPYTINCQRCAPAYELRRRGYDVTAVGNENFNHNESQIIPKEMWRDADGNVKNAEMLGARSNSAVTKELSKKMQIGERGTLSWAWAKENSGHIINVEMTEDGLLFIDAQTGRLSKTFEDYMQGNTFKKKLLSMKIGVDYNRVDDKYIDLENIGIIVEGAK